MSAEKIRKKSPGGQSHTTSSTMHDFINKDQQAALVTKDKNKSASHPTSPQMMPKTETPPTQSKSVSPPRQRALDKKSTPRTHIHNYLIFKQFDPK